MSAPVIQKERRAHTRHRVSRVAQVFPTVGGNGPRWQARLHDVSRNGLMLVAERRFEKNTFLNVRVDDDQGDELLSLFAQVVYVAPQGEGCWSMGCKFTKELNERDLSELLDAGQA